jgi:hypothetical protein
MNDLIRLAAERAALDFGANDGTFCAAGFSSEFLKFSPTVTPIDGDVVRVMLAGRPDIEPLTEGFYRLVEKGES